MSIHKHLLFVDNEAIGKEHLITLKEYTLPPFSLSNPVVKSIGTAKLIFNINIINIVIVFINNILFMI